MQQLVIHYGMPKTGTSSIQESLARHLDDPRFCYVRLGRSKAPNASGKIATAFADDPAGHHANRKRGAATEALAAKRELLRKRLRRELAAVGDRVGILSAEYVTQMSPEAFGDMCAVLAPARSGRQVRAVGYVRAPKSLMESRFQQQVKGGLFSLDLGRMYPRYRASLGKLESLAQRGGSVEFWKFAPASFPGGCVVQDFCQRLGIAFDPAQVVRVNEGLSLPALQLLFVYRRFGPGYGEGKHVIDDNRRLLNRLSGLPGSKLHFHSSLVAPVLARHADDLAWMEERLGSSLAEDLHAHDDIAIRGEQDLLRPGPETLDWLARQLGIAVAPLQSGSNASARIAAAVHRLKLKGTGRQRAEVADRVDAGLRDLYRRALEARPGLSAVGNRRAALLLRSVFAQIVADIERGGDDGVKVVGFGKFRSTGAGGQRARPVTLFHPAAGDDDET